MIRCLRASGVIRTYHFFSWDTLLAMVSSRRSLTIFSSIWRLTSESTSSKEAGLLWAGKEILVTAKKFAIVSDLKNALRLIGRFTATGSFFVSPSRYT